MSMRFPSVHSEFHGEISGVLRCLAQNTRAFAANPANSFILGPASE